MRTAPWGHPAAGAALGLSGVMTWRGNLGACYAQTRLDLGGKLGQPVLQRITAQVGKNINDPIMPHMSPNASAVWAGNCNTFPVKGYSGIIQNVDAK